MITRPLATSLRSIIERVSGASQILVLLDFDGTLAPFDADPSAAQIPAPTRAWLTALAANPRVTVGVISGRSLADLMTRVGLDGAVYAGNHGIEISGRGLHFVEPFAYMLEPALRAVVSQLRVRLDERPHVQVENKRYSATVHLRGAAEEERTRASEIVLSLVHTAPQFRCRVGRDALDILPRGGWHKGTAARWIQRELDLDDALVVYAGDDISDEDAFAALPGAITIKVGETPTTAAYLADSPPDLWALLAQLEGVLTVQ
jgi:trehalose 6-phosphate phosphatase